MSSENTNYKDPFGEAWKEVMENAEVPPSPLLWEKIGAGISHAETALYKKYFLIYRGIAAAVLLLVAFLGLYFWLGDTLPLEPKQIAKQGESANGTEKLAENPPPGRLEDAVENQGNGVKGNAANSNKAVEDVFDAIKVDDTTSNIAKSNEGVLREISTTSGTQGEAQKAIPALENKENMLVADNDSFDSKLTGSSLEELISSVPLIALEVFLQVPQVKPYAGKQWFAQENEQKNTALLEKGEWYAHVNLGTDFFQPNYSINLPKDVNFAMDEASLGFSNLPMAVTGRVVENQREFMEANMGGKNQPRPSVVYGFNAGFNLSKRWIIESGIHYANYQTSTHTTVSIQQANKEAVPVTLATHPEFLTLTPTYRASNSFSSFQDASYQPTTIHYSNHYGLNNSFQFVSVPLRAGYVIGIKRFRLFTKAGFAADFFQRNTITEDSGQLSTMEIANDYNTPFRRVLFNGLIGNEINYPLSPKYSLSLEANYRFAINSFSRQQEAFNSQPQSFGVGFIFRVHIPN